MYWAIALVGAALLAMSAFAPDNRWVGLAEDAASAAAAVGLWVAVRRTPGRGRRAWILLAAALTCWVLGDFIWDGYTFANITRPDVSLADVCYVAGYPLLALGLFELGRARAGRHMHEGLLDGCIFAAAATMAIWQLLVVPIAHSTDNLFTSLVWASYPLGDALLIAGIVWVALTPGRRSAPTYLFLTAMTATFVVDMLYAYLPTVSAFDVARLDPLYPITYALVAAAALHPERDELSTPGASNGTRTHPARFWLLAVALGTASIIPIAGRSDTWMTGTVLTILSLALSGAVIARFAFTVRAREQAQRALSYGATHDALTGVVNRVLLLDRIEHALARARGGQSSLAVLFLDLDRFKPVNDALGHHVGDEVLIETARRIGSVVRSSDTIGRLGGDEFVVVCEDITRADAVSVAVRLVSAISAPLDLADLTLRVAVSIGLAYTTDGLGNADVLIGSADTAMHSAKLAGGDRWELYDDRLQHESKRRHETEAALRRAIVNDEFVLHYQPIVRAADEAIVSFEALLRWQREDVLVSPDAFIPIAEETGMIVPMGEWVIERACDDLATWTRNGIVNPSIAVNVSALQLANNGLEDAVVRALTRTKTDPARLILEVTESVLVQDDQQGIAQLRRLRERGVRIAIDDFGTGYSSLAYLRHLPIDILKVDRTFIAELVHDPSASTVLAAVIHLAHTLGFVIVAEGAETAAQVELLKHLECDEIQGFYYARPAPIDTVEAAARSGRTAPAAGASAQAAVVDR
jgi:diguanylate cyclase (GGDEF)-like protein